MMQTQRLLWGLGRNQPQSGFLRAEALKRVSRAEPYEKRHYEQEINIYKKGILKNIFIFKMPFF